MEQRSGSWDGLNGMRQSGRLGRLRMLSLKGGIWMNFEGLGPFPVKLINSYRTCWWLAYNSEYHISRLSCLSLLHVMGPTQTFFPLIDEEVVITVLKDLPKWKFFLVIFAHPMCWTDENLAAAPKNFLRAIENQCGVLMLHKRWGLSTWRGRSIYCWRHYHIDLRPCVSARVRSEYVNAAWIRTRSYFISKAGKYLNFWLHSQAPLP